MTNLRIYAKVGPEGLTCYQYTLSDLKAENNQTNYDERFDLSDWHKLTEEGLAGEFQVVALLVLDQPSYDENAQRLVLSNQPRQLEGRWVISWDVLERTDSQPLL